MTDNNHPITPPPELVEQWWEEADKQLSPYYDYIATKAAQWGYEQRGAVNEAELQKARDEELEACCEWVIWELRCKGPSLQWSEDLRAARRPKPKGQAEEALETITEMANCMAAGFIPKRSDLETIRTALKRLQELEARDD